MPKILLLTGNAGVGKTTIAKAWAEARGGAAIVGDDVYLWMRSRDVRRACFHQEDLVAAVAIESARQFAAIGLDVAIDYVFRPTKIAELEAALSNCGDVRAVRLINGMAENHRRNRGRPCGVLPDETIESLSSELASSIWPPTVAQIDTTNLSVSESIVAVDRLFVQDCSMKLPKGRL